MKANILFVLESFERRDLRRKMEIDQLEIKPAKGAVLTKLGPFTTEDKGLGFF
jgi:hypothetical protein